MSYVTKISAKINTMQNINILIFVCEHCRRTEGTLNCGMVWQDIIDTAIDQWRKYLQVYVCANGEHFEYLLWTNKAKCWYFAHC